MLETIQNSNVYDRQKLMEKSDSFHGLQHTVNPIYKNGIRTSQETNVAFFTGQAINTLRTGDSCLRFYITTVQDG